MFFCFSEIPSEVKKHFSGKFPSNWKKIVDTYWNESGVTKINLSSSIEKSLNDSKCVLLRSLTLRGFIYHADVFFPTQLIYQESEVTCTIIPCFLFQFCLLYSSFFTFS